MAPNYIITSVNNKKIKSVDELIAIINSSNDKITLDGFYEKYKGKYPYSFYKDQNGVKEPERNTPMVPKTTLEFHSFN